MKKHKILNLTLASAILFNTITPAFAATQYTNSTHAVENQTITNTDDAQQTIVYAEIGSSFKITIPANVTSIGAQAFFDCDALTSATFKDTSTWYIGTSSGATTTKVTVTNKSTAAKYLRDTYATNYWTKQ